MRLTQSEYRQYFDRLSPNRQAKLPMPEEIERRVEAHYHQEGKKMPPWIKRMIWSKYFWGITTTLVLYFVVWQKSGSIKLAIATLALLGVIILGIYSMGQKRHTRRKRRNTK